MINNTTKIIRLITFLLMFFYVSIGNTKNMTIYDFSFEDIDGNQINLDKFKGKPIFMVNTASRCGFTPQYENLQNLFINYRNTDLLSFRQCLQKKNRIWSYFLYILHMNK